MLEYAIRAHTNGRPQVDIQSLKKEEPSVQDIFAPRNIHLAPSSFAPHATITTHGRGSLTQTGQDAEECNQAQTRACHMPRFDNAMADSTPSLHERLQARLTELLYELSEGPAFISMRCPFSVTSASFSFSSLGPDLMPKLHSAAHPPLHRMDSFHRRLPGCWLFSARH